MPRGARGEAAGGPHRRWRPARRPAARCRGTPPRDARRRHEPQLLRLHIAGRVIVEPAAVSASALHAAGAAEAHPSELLCRATREGRPG